MQSVYDELKNFFQERITFLKSFPEEFVSDSFLNPSQPALIVLDDQMNFLGPNIVKLMSETSHHKNCSVILLLQTLYPCNRYAETITTQATHMFLYDNPRDKINCQVFCATDFSN